MRFSIRSLKIRKIGVLEKSPCSIKRSEYCCNRWFWVGLLVSWSWTAFAGNYSDGLSAYKNKDYATAVKYWSSPDLSEHRAALFNLGRLHILGNGVEKDVEKAIEYYKQSAELGYKSAQFNLGLAYHNGIGVEKNVRQTVLLWTRAAEQDHDNAQYNLAAILWSGKGVPQDQALAMKWFRRSMSNENQQASDFLYSLFEPMVSELKDSDSLTWPQTDRRISALEELGLFKLGQQALSNNSYDQALNYWLQLAEGGHSESQLMIGKLYEAGKDANTDLETALIWYEKAAKSGQADAQLRLGMYYINEAPDPNNSLGLYWIQTAADRGQATAIDYMESID
jgi:TPR repeat protein